MSALKKKSAHYLSCLRKISKKPLFRKIYIVLALATIVITTLYWALLGAQIHAGNADQLANTYLFEQNDTFGAATIPSQHTFLLKWPVFLLIKLLGSTSLAFLVVTVGAVLITIGALVYVMYRIERRPLVFGTICLALASSLLLVPFEPYAGAALPVNMAMITTRNLEYVVFIASLILLVRTPKWQSWRWIAATALIGLLVASDKLFLPIYIGGALLALVFYSAVRNGELVKLAAKWLVAGGAGAALAMVLLGLINALRITHISGGTVAGPYGFIHTSKELVLGAIHAVLSLLTNLGANPVSDTRLLTTVSAQIFTHISTIGFLVNLCIVAIGVIASVQLVRLSAHRSKAKKKKDSTKTHDTALGLSTMLIWSTVAACGVFIVSSHYYPVDARYEGVAVFALFISLATFVRGYRFKHPEQLVIAGAIIFTSILIGLGIATSDHNGEKAEWSSINKRNSRIADAIQHHPVDVLVGDYWRVLPTKLAAKNRLTVNPLASCTQNRDVLSSRTWQLDLRQHSFAYLLTLDQSVTNDYPVCSLAQITKEYGTPNSSVVIAGDLKHPKELLLFYDKGINKTPAKAPRKPPSATPATVVPITIDNLPHVQCAEPTTMNIVAHQDDDLLFMNPDLLHDIKAGRCIRSVYVTAGDAGQDNRYYWLGRERGSEVAYLRMAGLAADTIWVERIVRLPGGQFITISNPKGNTKISLIFMHLPDGNTGGQGFDMSHYESLSALDHGRIPSIHTIDQQSIYSSDQLIDALTMLIQTYQPDQIHTQANMTDRHYPTDHSDHMAVGRYVKKAYSKYVDSSVPPPAPQLIFYIGYPIYGMPANVIDEDLVQKQNAFFDYAHYDNGVCGSLAQCEQEGAAYASYLKRQYKSDY